MFDIAGVCGAAGFGVRLGMGHWFIGDPTLDTQKVL